MSTPKTDDFRLEREDDRLVVTFTPTGEQFSFRTGAPDEAEPVKERPARSNAGDYKAEEVEQMATKLAKLALSPPPQT